MEFEFLTKSWLKLLEFDMRAGHVTLWLCYEWHQIIFWLILLRIPHFTSTLVATRFPYLHPLRSSGRAGVDPQNHRFTTQTCDVTTKVQVKWGLVLLHQQLGWEKWFAIWSTSDYTCIINFILLLFLLALPGMLWSS